MKRGRLVVPVNGLLRRRFLHSTFFLLHSLRVGREALESSSAVLQTAAKPSQLPTRHYRWPIVMTRNSGPGFGRYRISHIQALFIRYLLAVLQVTAQNPQVHGPTIA